MCNQIILFKPAFVTVSGKKILQTVLKVSARQGAGLKDICFGANRGREKYFFINNCQYNIYLSTFGNRIGGDLLYE